jgi:hypothetical protein
LSIAGVYKPEAFWLRFFLRNVVKLPTILL